MHKYYLGMLNKILTAIENIYPYSQDVSSAALRVSIRLNMKYAVVVVVLVVHVQLRTLNIKKFGLRIIYGANVCEKNNRVEIYGFR